MTKNKTIKKRKTAPKKPGRKTDLKKELLANIKKNILEGKTLVDTAKACELSESTLYTWHSDNYLNLADKVEGWKRDRKIMLATKNLEDFLKMKTDNTIENDGKVYTKRDTGLERIKADMTKFTLETLDKDNYSKRNEQTGKDGKAIENNFNFKWEEEQSPSPTNQEDGQDNSTKAKKDG